MLVMKLARKNHCSEHFMKQKTSKIILKFSLPHLFTSLFSEAINNYNMTLSRKKTEKLKQKTRNLTRRRMRKSHKIVKEIAKKCVEDVGQKARRKPSV